MNVFDFHTHIYPDTIAPRAIENVTRAGVMKNSSDGTVSALLEEMKKAGVTCALNLPLALSPDSERGVNQWSANLHQSHPSIYSLGSIHPDTPHPLERLTWIKSLGLPGIKLHSEFQEFTPNDPRMTPIYQACESLDLFILFHMGKDLIFLGEPRAQLPDFVSIAQQYPKLKMVLAHMGGIELLDPAKRLDFSMFPNVYFDLAYVLPYIEGEPLAELIRKVGVNQVLFGTDSPWVDINKHLQKFMQLPLTQDEFEKILWRNALHLLHLQESYI